ncbi:methylated-DNA--[protein]-cysteine S-methyltransferase [Companilactobacillus sp. HBUAS59544]|jgi:methylated-DNA-[protein]-cysteine S-methyltransferase|uniref:methylated-DNA--[protein]-cysteine S-methyltransferase n=1 Tax=Companilactobacillus sp. HBUAS59544 TaxID=3109363 RepID=UPI002FF17FFD
MKKIEYQLFNFKNHQYIIAGNDDSLQFIGSWDKGVTELRSFFPDYQIIEVKKGLEKYQDQLKEYFNHQRTTFTMPLEFNGTDFQKAVWKQLLEIPYGQTRSYTQIAQAIGRPNSVRAVGSAIGKNPLLIVVPCHRVLTKDNRLGGYRGGLEMKQALLQLEKN